MDPGQNHFLETALMQSVNRVDYPARFDAPRQSARKRHDTISAELIAAFLELEERSRMTVERHRAQLDFHALLAQVRDHHALVNRTQSGAFKIGRPSEPDQRV